LQVGARTGLRPTPAFGPALRSFARSHKRDISRDATILIGVAAGVAQARGYVATPIDAVNYWAAGTSAELYPDQWGHWWGGQYLYYPPPTSQLSGLLQPLGWQLFIVAWTTLIFMSMWYCARDWSVPLLVLGLPAILWDVPYVGTFASYALNGNMQWILAASVLVALRHPAAWAVTAVTKVTPAVGILWHIVRREWRSTSQAIGATAIVLLVSLAVSPHVWIDWAGFTIRNYTLENAPIPLFPVPFGIRLGTAAVLVVWGARTDRRWTVPVAAGWALPALYGLGFLPFWIVALQLTDLPNRSAILHVLRRPTAGEAAG
jgi:hypothetical protein